MRIVVVALALMLVSAPSVEAQGADRTSRIGFVGPYSPGLDWSILQGYQERLRELGWVEGQNIVTTYRWADGDFSRLPGLVDSIMSAPPDLLVLPCGPAIKTARDLSRPSPSWRAASTSRTSAARSIRWPGRAASPPASPTSRPAPRGAGWSS